MNHKAEEAYELCCDFGYDVTSPIPSAEPVHRNFHSVVPAVVGTTAELFPGVPERYEYAEFVSFLKDDDGQSTGMKCRIKPSPRIIRLLGGGDGPIWEVDLLFGKAVFVDFNDYKNGKNTHTYRRLLLRKA